MKRKPRKNTSPIWLLPQAAFCELVINAKTVSEILAFFGMANKGGNFRTLKKRMQIEGLSDSHFKSNFGVGRLNCDQPLSEVMVENSSYARGSLKRRLIAEGILVEKCDICGLPPFWNGEKLVLVLDHKNGINNDHRLKNLRLICPNCNSQTPTFAGRKHRIKRNCATCGCELNKPWKYCQPCLRIMKGMPRLERRKYPRPSKEDLGKLLWEKPSSTIAKQLGVSGTAIEKWAKSYGLSKPEKGYWQKKQAGKL